MRHPWRPCRPGRQRSSAWLLMALGLVLGTAASACASPRSVIGTTASPCYQAIPIARHAVGEHGRFVGVRHEKVAGMERRFRHVFLPRPALPASADVCLVAYSGPYGPGSVRGAARSATGRYAVVVVSRPSDHLVVTYLVDRLPGSFRHLA